MSDPLSDLCTYSSHLLFILLTIYLFGLFPFGQTLFSQNLEPTPNLDYSDIHKQNINNAKLPPIDIENADEGEVVRGEKTGTNILRLRGRVKVRLGEGHFFADTIIIDTDSQEIYGEGNLIYKAKDSSEIKAERIIYNRRLGQGILYNASGYKNPIHFIGKDVRLLAQQRLSVSHARFTSNARHPPHYHFTAYRLGFHKDGGFFALGVWFYVGGVPLLPLPFLSLSPWGSGLLTQVGYGARTGAFIQNSYEFEAPESNLFLLPSSYSIFFDHYRVTGTQLGVQFTKKTNELDYFFDIGYARFQRYNIKDGKVTNEVERCEGGVELGIPRVCSQGREAFHWHKNNILLNSKNSDLNRNNIRNIHVKYENYNHYLYEYEFGRRFQPEDTISALNKDLRLGDGIQRPDLKSSLVYEEEWDSFHLRIQLENKEVWRVRQNFQDSSYELSQSTLPSLELNKQFTLATLPSIESPIYWNHKLSFISVKEYSEGVAFYNHNQSDYKTDLELTLPLLAWFSWDTKWGYGARRNVVDSNVKNDAQRVSLEHEGQRNNYDYLFTQNTWMFGEEELFIDLAHRHKKSFNVQRPDIPQIDRSGFVNNQKVNEVEFELSWFAFPNMSFHGNTVYDFRKFPIDVPEKDRWDYPVFRTDIFLDWTNLLRESRENLLSRNKVHFLSTHLTNDYVYDTIRQKSHSNIFGLTFDMGGFDTFFFRRLRYLEVGLQWYHFYADSFLDHFRYILKLDMQVTNWVYLQTVVESRASDPGRYSRSSRDSEGNSNRVHFFDDIVNSTGLRGHQRRKDSIFNLVYYHTALILDLGDWEFRFGYELEQRYIPETSGVESIVYYDQRFFFGLNLIHFNIAGIGKKPSRFLFRRPTPTN